MKYDYETYLHDKLSRIVVELFKEEDIPEVFISEEQNFAKMDKLTPNSIYVVIKYLSSSIEYYTETMPIQILVLSEQNSFEKAQMIMNKFATDNNWQILTEGNTRIKQQYNSPVILNNYVEVGYGYRSVLYITGTLFIMENVVDVSNITINGVELKPISCTVSYSMSTNTQQLATEEIASSSKTVSTFAITLTIPMREVSDNPGLVTKIMKIMNEQISGNTEFEISFLCGLYDDDETSESYGEPLPIQKTMRLISAQINTAPNQIPGLQIGFMK